MERGMYRWWEGEGSAEAWFARVELEPGVWESVTFQDYEARALQPAFWDLSLKDEHFEKIIGRIGRD